MFFDENEKNLKKMEQKLCQSYLQLIQKVSYIIMP